MHSGQDWTLLVDSIECVYLWHVCELGWMILLFMCFINFDTFIYFVHNHELYLCPPWCFYVWWHIFCPYKDVMLPCFGAREEIKVDDMQRSQTWQYELGCMASCGCCFHVYHVIFWLQMSFPCGLCIRRLIIAWGSCFMTNTSMSPR